MNKKGQVYIIAALIIIAVFFGLMARSNIFREEETLTEFNEISKNYAVESNKFLNSLINTGNIDVHESFSNFTFLFTSYSKSKNPGFGLIYAYEYNGKIQVGNYLNKPVSVKYGSKQRNIHGCYDVVPSSISFEGLDFEIEPTYLGNLEIDFCTFVEDRNPSQDDITIVISGTPYNFKIIQGHPQLMIVSRMEKEEQRRVFLEGEVLNTEAYNDALEQVCCNTDKSTQIPGCIDHPTANHQIVDCVNIYRFSPVGCANSPHCVLEEGICKSLEGLATC